MLGAHLPEVDVLGALEPSSVSSDPPSTDQAAAPPIGHQEGRKHWDEDQLEAITRHTEEVHSDGERQGTDHPSLAAASA